MRPRTTRAFVDRVEGSAAVLVVGRREYSLPAAALPDGAGEGSWVEVTVAPARGPRRRPPVPWKDR